MANDTSDHAQEGDEEPAACQSCRKRKLKCSRQQPCSQCDRLGAECVYDVRRRPGVKSGAIEAITQRLSNLEHMFLGQGLLLQSLLPQQRNPSSTNGDTHNAESALQEQVDTLRSALMQASKNEDNALDEAASGPQVTISTAPRDVSSSGDAGSATVPRLPPDHVVDHLVDWYFANVHRWIPILHARRFKERLAAPDSRAKVHSILTAIVSLGFKRSRAAEVDDTEAEMMTTKYRHAVIVRSMEHFSVENLQALVIVAFDTIGSGRGPSSWSIIGSMARTVEQLHLNTEADDVDRNTAAARSFLLRRIAFLQPARTWIEDEERRRLFWTVFMMDRFCGVATGWSNSVPVGDVRRRLPCEGAIWEAGTPVKTPFFGCSQDLSSADTDTPSRMVRDSEEMDTIGGFAFCLEATETLNLVTNFFLRQAVHFENKQALQLWLMRFKELDLRLVKYFSHAEDVNRVSLSI